MKRDYVYACPHCGATKTIVENTERTGQKLRGAPTNTLPCGWRDCLGRAVLIREGATHI